MLWQEGTCHSCPHDGKELGKELRKELGKELVTLAPMMGRNLSLLAPIPAVTHCLQSGSGTAGTLPHPVSLWDASQGKQGVISEVSFTP